MMTKIASVAAVLAVAGAASAGTFNLLGTIDISDAPGVVGGNDINTENGFYNNGFGALNGGPNPAFFGVDANLEWDSYWALDGAEANGQASPSVAPGYTSAGQDGSGATNVIAGTLAQYNSGFATPGTGRTSVIKDGPFGNGGYLFIGRLTTLGAGSSLFNGATGGAVLGRFGISNGAIAVNVSLELDGAGGDSAAGTLFFKSDSKAITLTTGQEVVVHDLYLTNVPTPGALALFGLAGAAATRRRRA